jgi:hypothetical protein
MHGIMEHVGGGVNKLETVVQILELFQSADFILLIETWHFSSQHLPHVEGFDSLMVVHTVQLGKTKAIKHNVGLLLTFVATLTIVVTYSQIFQTYAYFTFFWAF